LQTRYLGEWRRDGSSPTFESSAERLLGHSIGGQWIPRLLATTVRAQLPSEFPSWRINAHGLSPGERSAPLRGHVAGDPGGTNSAAIPDWSPANVAGSQENGRGKRRAGSERKARMVLML